MVEGADGKKKLFHMEMCLKWILACKFRTGVGWKNVGETLWVTWINKWSIDFEWVPALLSTIALCRAKTLRPKLLNQVPKVAYVNGIWFPECESATTGDGSWWELLMVPSY